MILHIVSTSPFNSSHLVDCLNVITESDALLLIGDGVYGLTNAHLANIEDKSIKEVFAIKDDCLARALDTTPTPCVLSIDFHQMVEIVERYPLCQSWF
ncbi:sulfurtransferase complex subunit TusB [Sessilibacter corallicola]|uniref:Sulfurtransferase complex subunit TusB n=1 Tax=Sessilibacter corallicola TaxID=2904075 RepID=A0ABQ0A9C1_9GAMM